MGEGLFVFFRQKRPPPCIDTLREGLQSPLFEKISKGENRMEQNPFLAALCMTILAGLSTGLGGLTVLWFVPTGRMLARSLGFAAGVMLSVSLGDLLPGSLAFFETRLSSAGAGAAVGLLLAAGMALAALMGELLPDEGRLMGQLAGEPEVGDIALSRSRALHCGIAVGLALVLHNLPEGILTLFSGVQDPRAGLRLSLAIALHNLPEGISTAAPLWYATGNRLKSAGAAFASGLAEPVGAVLAYLVLAPFLNETLLQGMSLLAAGVMCWVSVAELLVNGFSLGQKADAAAGFAVGVCGMTLGIAILA